jgi:hypothetical protein
MRKLCVLATLIMLAGCAADTRARQNLQAMGGSFRLDPVPEHQGRWRATLTNAWDIGYDGELRADRLAITQGALRCPGMKVLDEREFPGGAGVPFWREPRTYVITVEC